MNTIMDKEETLEITIEPPAPAPPAPSFPYFVAEAPAAVNPVGFAF